MVPLSELPPSSRGFSHDGMAKASKGKVSPKRSKSHQQPQLAAKGEETSWNTQS